MNLDEVISEAYYNSEMLDLALNRMFSLRKNQQITKPKNAEGLHRSLKHLAITVSRLSEVDYEEVLTNELKRIEENNRRADELNAKYKKPKAK